MQLVSNGLVGALVVLLLTGCGPFAAPESAAPSKRSSANPSGAAVRPRPPIVAAGCAELTAEDRARADAVLLQVSRAEPLFPHDAFAKLQQRDIVGLPAPPVGVILYIPAEYGIGRAYLERILSCHAVAAPAPGEHPNDPLLVPGIVSVDVEEADGGQFQIRIFGRSRHEGERLLERARAIERKADAGSVSVEQVSDDDAR